MAGSGWSCRGGTCGAYWDLAGGVLCNDASLEKQSGEEQIVVGDPTEGALIMAGAKARGGRLGANLFLNPLTSSQNLPLNCLEKGYISYETGGFQKVPWCFLGFLGFVHISVMR